MLKSHQFYFMTKRESGSGYFGTLGSKNLRKGSLGKFDGRRREKYLIDRVQYGKRRFQTH